MARAEHFFTYRLFARGRVLRIGKGGVATRTDAAVARYLLEAYPYREWDTHEHEWHSTESAAYKGETRKVDGYTQRTGDLPPWNARRGGGGGQSFVACRAVLIDGTPCRNLAHAGNYGYCGVHR